MSNFEWLQIALAGFFVLPIAACLARAFGPRWFDARLAVCAVSLLGWVLSNLATQFYFGNLDEHLRDETGRFINNLARERVLFGGFYALIYYEPFALFYGIARWARRLSMKRR